MLLRSLREGTDYSTATGRSSAGIFAALAAYERELMNERAAAGPRGRPRPRPDTGRPSKLTPAKPAKSGRSASAGNRSPSSSLATAWPSTPRAIRPLPDRPRPTTGGTCEPFNLRIQETALARRR